MLSQNDDAHYVPDIPPPVDRTLAPAFAAPAGACDAHAHVFGPTERARLHPEAHFRPHACPLARYVRMLRVLGIQRAVLVQPSVYGTDHSVLSEALTSGDFALRGVAVVPPNVDDGALETMHRAGYRGIRVNTASATPGLTLQHVRTLADRIRPLGWHLQFFVDLQRQPELEGVLASLKVPVVIDHFGKVPAREGLASPGARALLRLLRHDHCWAKLMGPYFVSTDFPAHRDVDALAQAMVRIAPDRLVWGSDWPHPSARSQMPNDGDLMNMLARWVPDSDVRQRVLVQNPARLYDFDPL